MTKRSELDPERPIPALGTISTTTLEGLVRTPSGMRQRIIWAACPACGAQRWVQLKRPDRLCQQCSAAQARSHRKRKQPYIPHPTMVGTGNPRWAGGRKTMGTGYVYVWVAPDDPMASMRGKTNHYALEHRLVMARELGRPLTRQETVHHKNGIRDDNRLENLELWTGNHSHGVRVSEHHCPGCRCFEPSAVSDEQDTHSGQPRR